NSRQSFMLLSPPGGARCGRPFACLAHVAGRCHLSRGIEPTSALRGRRIMRHLASTALAALLLLPPRPAAADEVLVFAAAGLTAPLQQLGAAHERAAHDQVTFNFGASSALARQITAGAPADVFFSADVARMEELEKASLVERSERRNVLSNTLVIVT